MGMVTAVKPKATVVLSEKEPVDWDVTSENGIGNGYLFLSQTKVHYVEEYTYLHYVRPGKVLELPRRRHMYEYRDVAALRLRGLVPETSYTLVYYGNEEHNDVWPYATCLQTFTTNSYGSYFNEGTVLETNLLGNFLTDDVPEKYWVVTTSDVDCLNGQMTAWNPENYLFEFNTI
jgi:hypothetical protein